MKAQMSLGQGPVGDIYWNINFNQEAFLLSCIYNNKTLVSDDKALSDSLYKENIRIRHRIFGATAPE